MRIIIADKFNKQVSFKQLCSIHTWTRTHTQVHFLNTYSTCNQEKVLKYNYRVGLLVLLTEPPFKTGQCSA